MTLPLLPIIDIAGRVLDRVLPNTAERDKVLAELQVELARQISQQNIAQTEINKVEAAHRNLFVSGWRPCIGWICAIALGWQFLAVPVLQWYAAFYAPALTIPSLGYDGLFELVLGMLGLGGLRTYEKKVGVTR